jgi:hypothetical protein
VLCGSSLSLGGVTGSLDRKSNGHQVWLGFEWSAQHQSTNQPTANITRLKRANSIA